MVDDNGKFREDSFQKALNALVPAPAAQPQKSIGKMAEETDIFKMVKMIIQRQYDPVILFSFSKRECESLAMQVNILPFSIFAKFTSIQYSCFVCLL